MGKTGSEFSSAWTAPPHTHTRGEQEKEVKRSTAQKVLVSGIPREPTQPNLPESQGYLSRCDG